MNLLRKHTSNLLAVGLVGYTYSKGHIFTDQSTVLDQSTNSVIIIGSGPSAHTAAIYAARANLNPSISYN